MCAGVVGRGIGIGGCGRWMEGHRLGRGRNGDAVDRMSRWGIFL